MVKRSGWCAYAVEPTVRCLHDPRTPEFHDSRIRAVGAAGGTPVGSGVPGAMMFT